MAHPKRDSMAHLAKKPRLNKATVDYAPRYTELTDDELFHLPPEHLQGEVILRLAHTYTNGEIIDRANAANPGSFTAKSTVGNRLYAAVKAAAQASGCTTQDIREQIAEARSKNSMSHEEPISVTQASMQSNNELTAVTEQTIRFSRTLAPGLQTHILFIFVGPQREATTIHTALLPIKTRAILEERAQQNMVQQQPIYLIDDLPETFEVYRLFLYTGKIFSNDAQTDQDTADDGHSETHGDREWVRLAHAYFMGLSLDDEKFRNATIDALVEKVAETDRYPTGLAAEVYAHTAGGDKLRSLIVDLHVWKGQGTGVRAPHDDASGPIEFVQDVLRGLAEARSDAYDPDVQVPWEADRCKYHVHTTTAQCVRKTVSVLATGSTPQLSSTSGKAAHKCTPCNQTFPSSRSLNSHRQSETHKEIARAWAARAAQQLGS